MRIAFKTAAFALLIAAGIPSLASAHRTWMLPSATVLSGDEAWVTVDAAVSNDLFYFEHQPLRLEGLRVVNPDGSEGKVENQSTGKYRSTFDVRLQDKGTHKIVLQSEGIFARYKENGAAKRWRGTVDRLQELPADAEDLQVTQSQRVMETFVTLGQTTDTVFKPRGVGLEVLPVTHPNNLFVGEPARFRLLLDGAPAAGVDVAVIPGGIRYRDQLNEMKITTKEDGEFIVTWPTPGMYWVNASVQDDKASLDRPAKRSAGYTATLEVLPQ